MAVKILSYVSNGPLMMTARSDGKETRCKAYELILNKPSNVQLITFRNRYSAYYTLRVKRVDSGDMNWETSIDPKQIMTSPHLDEGSQDIIMTTANDSKIQWSGIISVLIVIRQPSFVWKSFEIDDIAIYGNAIDDVNDDVLRSLSSETDDDEVSVSRKISGNLSTMFDRLLRATKSQTDVITGSYDVGANYEIHGLI